MSSVNLVKPSSRTQPVLVGGIQTANGTYNMKVNRAAMRFGSPLEDLTGDGDNSPCIENNGYLYGQVQLDGFMVDEDALNVLFIVDVNPKITLAFHVADGHVFTADYMVEWIQIRYDRRGRYVGVVMDLQKQGGATETFTELPAA